MPAELRPLLDPAGTGPLGTHAPAEGSALVAAHARRGRPGGGQRRRERAACAVAGFCWAVLLAQLVALLLWSSHLVDLASLGRDFGIYYQPWYLIAHGHLLARNTFQGGYLFVRNDGELVVYLLAPLYWLFPNHAFGYLVLQDLAIAGSEAVCLALVADALPLRAAVGRGSPWRAAAARLLVVALLVLDPFVYWVASFDLHMEVFGTCFALAALRALLRRRRSLVLWALLTALCGAASLLYLIGVALAAAAVLLVRSRRRPGQAAHRSFAGVLAVPAGLAAGALAWLGVLGALHATMGSPAAGYAYLAGSRLARPSPLAVALGALSHPASALASLASHGWNLWANTSPGGLVGIATPAGLLALPTLVANNLLDNQNFSYPSFQNFVVYAAVALGSTAVVATLASRRRLVLVAAGLALAMLANAAGWFQAWFGLTSSMWARLTPGAAAVVRAVAERAVASDEVVASQGLVGLLAGRSQVYSFGGSLDLPLRSRRVYFVLSETQGAQTATEAQTREAIEAVATLPGVQVLDAGGAGMWVYRWDPPVGATRLRLAGPGARYPVWMTAGPAASALLAGPVVSWALQSDGPSGYLLEGDRFVLPPGRYVASFRLQADGPVDPEVWNGNTGKLVAGGRDIVTLHPLTVRLAFDAAPPRGPLPGPIDGSGWFRDQAIATAPDATIELRIWTPGTIARAWWVSVAPVRR